MKKGLLVYRINRDDPANAGVIKKCTAQYEAFRQSGFQVDILILCNEGVLLNEQLILRRNLPAHSLRIYWFYFFSFGPILQKLGLKTPYDFIYLRHPFFDPQLDRALRAIKAHRPQTKLLLEINTYPYDAEPRRLLHRFSLWMDQYYRAHAHQYIDRIIDYGKQQEIWRIPTINVRNGIAIPPQAQAAPTKVEQNIIRFIAVGNWSYWHGLDRFIKGVKNLLDLQPNFSLQVMIVGDGPAVGQLSALVHTLELKKYIRFYPATFGEALDQLFHKANIGIGTLGLHRKGVALDSSLKHREYCARNLPFILSAPDLDFPEDLPFVHYLAADEEAVDVLEILRWYEALEVGLAPQKYAATQLSWSAQLRPVFCYLQV